MKKRIISGISEKIKNMAIGEKTKYIVFIIIAIGLFCICLPILTYKGEVNSKYFLELLSIVFSWPVAIVVISLLLFTKFGSALDYFFRNIGSIKVPGGIEIQAQSSFSPKSTEEKGSDITPQQEEQLEKTIKQLIEESKLNQQEKTRLETEVAKAYGFAKYWKFTYLNNFFVLKTKQVLNWIAGLGKIGALQYHAVWLLSMQNVDERNTTIDVLTQNNMLLFDGVNYEITSDGYEFLQFIGYILSKPNP